MNIKKLVEPAGKNTQEVDIDWGKETLKQYSKSKKLYDKLRDS